MKPGTLSTCTLLHLLLLEIAGFRSVAFSLENRRSIPGIWKLISDALPYEQDIRAKLEALLPEEAPPEGVLLRLDADGTLKQCNEGYREGKWISGRWHLDEGDNKLRFAIHRQYFGPQFDVMFEGTIHRSADDPLMLEGSLLKGTFTYPVTHASFFENLMSSPEEMGRCSLEQVIATQSIMSKEGQSVNDSKHDHRSNFQQSDFYNCTFLLPVEAMQPGQSQSHPCDLRAFPISFFPNNTFQALAVNKILRGRFEVTQDDQLVFDVSLFGAGRSMPGSVFSEGIGLSHEDRRSYVGDIQENHVHKFVKGSVTFGTYLGSDARPEPVGVFQLRGFEVSSLDHNVLDSDEDFFASGSDDDFDTGSFQ